MDMLCHVGEWGESGNVADHVSTICAAVTECAGAGTLEEKITGLMDEGE